MTESIAQPADRQGRLAVDDMLRLAGSGDVWVAGDVARVEVDGKNVALMSCQHAIPQGSYAGYNAVNMLDGRRPRRYKQHLYVTCLDLGSWGALLTVGFARDKILASGQQAKEVKRFINRSMIYPALDDPRALLRRAKPPRGGRVSAAVACAPYANPTARSLLVRNAPDGPTALGTGRAAPLTIVNGTSAQHWGFTRCRQQGAKRLETHVLGHRRSGSPTRPWERYFKLRGESTTQLRSSGVQLHQPTEDLTVHFVYIGFVSLIGRLKARIWQPGQQPLCSSYVPLHLVEERVFLVGILDGRAP